MTAPREFYDALKQRNPQPNPIARWIAGGVAVLILLKLVGII